MGCYPKPRPQPAWDACATGTEGAQFARDTGLTPHTMQASRDATLGRNA